METTSMNETLNDDQLYLRDQINKLLINHTTTEILDYLWLINPKVMCEWIEDHDYLYCDDLDRMKEDLGYYK